MIQFLCLKMCMCKHIYIYVHKEQHISKHTKIDGIKMAAYEANKWANENSN